LLSRIEKCEQRVSFLFPGCEVDLPDVDFIIRQDAIEMPQGLGVHSLRYHGEREAANLLLLMMAV
jgi:hypothetical protein